MSHVEALALARSGRLQEAARASAVAVDIARRSGRRERAALFDVATAVREAFYGNAAAARQKVTTALDLARGRDVDYAAAFALALSDDVARSRALADDLAKNFPEDTSVQYLYLPTLRAVYSLTAHDPAGAIHALQTATRYDLALGGIGFIGRGSGASIPSTSADWRTSRPVNPSTPSASFSGFSIIEASCSSIPWTRWRACNWRERSRSRATP